jgi:hypothetical protein
MKAARLGAALQTRTQLIRASGASPATLRILPSFGSPSMSYGPACGPRRDVWFGFVLIRSNSFPGRSRFSVRACFGRPYQMQNLIVGKATDRDPTGLLMLDAAAIVRPCLLRIVITGAHSAESGDL